LFQVDPAAVRTRVEQLPGIQRAEVRRVWPRRLVVTVTERVPVAVWQVGGVTYTVDGDGVVLDLTPGPSLLTIYQLDGAPGLAPGDRVDGDTVRLATRLRDVAPARVGRQITRFEWTQGAGLEVTTDRGERVRFGDGANLDYKLAVWRALMDQARKDKREVREIDLRFEDRVVYR
jgi:cell division protein FtsQ